MVGSIIFASIAGFLIVLGVLIKYLRFYVLIAGYNTTPKSQRADVDIVNAAKFIGNICFATSIIFIFGAILAYLELITFLLIDMALVFPLIIYTIVHAKKFENKGKNNAKKR